MKTIGDETKIALQNIKNLSDAKEEKSRLSEDAIVLVNQLFTVLEQHVKYFKLNKTYSEADYLSTKREWVKTFGLNNLTREEVIAGANKIRSSQKVYDDLLPIEFINICRDKSSEERCRVPEYKRLPEPERTEESKKIASNALSEMKRKLGLK